MQTSFRIIPLPLRNFAPLFSLKDSELAEHGARRVVADSHPGFPCRVSLVDAAVGESLILLPVVHHDVTSPYRASGPVYVREAAVEADLAPNEIPPVAASRLLSVRAYDRSGMMLDCEVTEGSQLGAEIERLFAKESVNYLHLHNARAGCYSCRVERI